ncbi:MAG: hypothetical protein AAFX05_11305 [Planctomycetota bacterium]
MGLDIAIEELYATGWSSLDTTGHEYSPGGKLYPTVERVEQEFHTTGRELTIRKVDLFDCFRAEWTQPDGTVEGGIVGATREEAAVYALAQLRRSAGTPAAMS